MLEGGGGETRYPPALSSDFAKTDIPAKARSRSDPHIGVVRSANNGLATYTSVKIIELSKAVF